MTRKLENLQPEKVFYYFEEISNIPRGSGNEKAISDYMVAFAQKHNLWVKQDEANNIYIKKPATKGYENAPTIIMQGHLDMVCEKNKDTEFNFETQGLDLYIDGDFIRARGTTLGADNGVAIAYQMAVLADETLEHPAIEALMTTEEETGMGGVASLHPEYLEGKILLNLDTDNEGEFLVSCAGGARARMMVPATWAMSGKGIAYQIVINGLVGGHSGAEIHHERANANVLMGRTLSALQNKTSFELGMLSGGTKDNVITRECEAVVFVDASDTGVLEQVIADMQESFAAEYAAQDAEIAITLTKTSFEKRISEADTKRVVDLLTILPNGVMGMSHQIAGLVETSLNIGVVEAREDGVHVTLSIRSSLPSRKEEIINKLRTISTVMGVACEVGSYYPAWVYEPESKIREIAIQTYKDMYQKEPKIEAIHAGLECGFLSEKLKGVDMIAFGPNVYAIHSPEEKASISSMKRVYEYLVQLLKNIK